MKQNSQRKSSNSSQQFTSKISAQSAKFSALLDTQTRLVTTMNGLLSTTLQELRTELTATTTLMRELKKSSVHSVKCDELSYYVEWGHCYPHGQWYRNLLESISAANELKKTQTFIRIRISIPDPTSPNIIDAYHYPFDC